MCTMKTTQKTLQNSTSMKRVLAYFGDNVKLDYGEGEEVEESREREDGNAQHTPIESDSISLTMEPLLNITTEQVADDRNVTQALPPTTELANREKESDGRRVQGLVNDHDLTQLSDEGIE